MKVETLNKYTEIKQPTNADKTSSSGTLVLQSYPAPGASPVSATAGQTVINLGFAVPQDTNTPRAFWLLINGQKLPSDDYSFTTVISGQSSQVTLVAPLVGGEAIEAFLMGTTITAYPNPSSVQANLNDLAAGLSNLGNVITLPATTNNTYTSTASNNPYGLFFDDGKPLFGAERFHAAGYVAITDPADIPCDSNGWPGYFIINAKTGLPDKRFRIYGLGWYQYNVHNSSVHGLFAIGTQKAGDYICITSVMTQLNLIAMADTSFGSASIYLNGVDTANDVSEANAAILMSNKYAINTIQNLPYGSPTQAINTIKLVSNSSSAFFFYGFEIINNQYDSTHNISVPSCTKVVKGKNVSFPAFVGANSLNYKGLAINGGDQYSGNTKGSRVAWFANENGYYVSKHNDIYTNEQSGTLVAGDTITGIVDATQFWNSTNSQGNIVRFKDALTGAVNRALLVPTGGSPTGLTLAKDFTGAAKSNVLTANGSGSNIQYRDNGTSACTFSAGTIYAELYGKALNNADFSNSEFVREIHWREFGCGTSYDFSQSTYSFGSNYTAASHVLDDDTTNLLSTTYQPYSGPGIGTGIGLANSSQFLAFTFIGSGVELKTAYAGTFKIASDLPFGTHMVKLALTGTDGNHYVYVDGVFLGTISGVYGYMTTVSFIIYQPKTPILSGYVPEFSYNIMADQVLTNIPTIGTTAPLINYCGIDQGILRKQGLREFAYTGTTSYNQSGNYGTTLWYVNTNPGVAASASLTVFGQGNYRIWHKNSNGSDALNIFLDGVQTATCTAGAGVGETGYLAPSMGSSPGVHVLNTVRNGTAGYLNWYAIDFSTPIYEHSNWNTNPFLDYFISGNGVADKRNSALIAATQVPKEYKVSSTVASSVNITTTNIIVMGLVVLDKGKWSIDIFANAYKGNTNDSVLYPYIYFHDSGYTVTAAQGEAVKWYTSGMNTIVQVGVKGVEVHLTKRTAVFFGINSQSTDYYTYYNNTIPFIKARKISN
jgi:hypothetical protein